MLLDAAALATIFPAVPLPYGVALNMLYHLSLFLSMSRIVVPTDVLGVYWLSVGDGRT